MERGCFIGIDQGSSSTKAVVVGMDGTVLFTAKRQLSPPLREGLGVEQDPEEIPFSLREVLAEAVLEARNNALTVLGAGLSCQRSSCLAWNEVSGEPLSPVISWRDTRGSALVEALDRQSERIFSTTGLPLTPYYSASKLRWLFENTPASRERTTVFGPLSSFLVQHLTKRPRASVDHTNAARTQLMDIRTLEWDPGMIGLFDLEAVRLPEIVPTAADHGSIVTAGGQIPLLAVIGDQQAALLGLGVTQAGEGGINYGTGGFLLMNTGTVLTPADGLMASVHYSTEKERHYLLEGSVNAAGDALEWLRTRLGLFKSFDEVDDLCWKAKDDVVAFLGLNGTGAPHWEKEVSTCFYGMTARTEPEDLIRAAVECIAFFLQDIADAASLAGIAPASVVASGGLSSLSYLIQVQADLLGRDIIVSPSTETSALGAAFLAGMARGTWSAADIAQFAHGGESLSPRKNPGIIKRRERWKALHEAVRALDRI